jgi:uncharacterized protein with HEPN domain
VKRAAEAYVEDILKYSRHIISESANLTEPQFNNDFNKQLLMMRCIEVIGEACKLLQKVDPNVRERYPDVQWKDIAGMRDILIHHYEEANLHRIWKTIIEDVPVFEKQALRILEDYALQKKKQDGLSL